ncbi:MAG: hypothetical protein ABI718_04475 [Acidobacteriota bacterium]
MLRLTILAMTLILLPAPETVAQKKKVKAPAMAAPAQVNVVRVNDRRGGEPFQRLELVIELPTVPSTGVSAGRVLLRSAVDDSGNNLMEETQGEPALGSLSVARRGDSTRPAALSFTLASPLRNATSVREVRGEIELYMPSRDANSVALLPKFMSSKGKALSHKALKANGVEIMVLSEPQYEAEKKRLADLKRKEMVKEEYSEDTIASSIEIFLENFLAPEPNDVVVKIKDPKKVIQEFSWIDSSGGEPKRLNTREDNGLTFLFTWEGPPQPDWALRVSMLTPKNVVRFPFVLRDVPLP